MVSPLDVFEEANATYDRLSTLIAVQSTSGLRTLASLNYQLRAVSDVTSENGKLQIQEEFSSGQEVLDGIIAQAANASANISSCLDGNQDELYEVANNYTLELVYCIFDSLSIVDLILDDATEVINGTTATVLILGDDLAQCRENLLCVSAVLASINIQLDRLPKIIQEELDESQIIVGNSQIIIQTCAINTVLRMRTTTARILREISNCANSIINQ